MRLLRIIFSTVVVSSSLVGQTYTISTFAGGGLPVNIKGSAATLRGLYGVALDSAGNVFIAIRDRHIVVRLDRAGQLTLVAGSSTPARTSDGDGGLATSAHLFLPHNVAVDSAGNVYIVDGETSSPAIRKVSSDGVITTVAGNGISNFYGTGDGGAATSASLTSPGGITFDASGNLYIADIHSIRKVSNGVITTVAGITAVGTPLRYDGDNGPATSAHLNGASSVAVDTAGNLYIADSGNNRIRKVSNGVITTVAGNGTAGFSGDGGPATSAQLNGPRAVAVDSAGNLYVADTGNSRVRKISDGVISTLVGNGVPGFSGDGGPATNAQLNIPSGMAIDSQGNIYVTDIANDRIRYISAGIIQTVAGGGVPTADNLGSVVGSMAIDSTGDLYIGQDDFLLKDHDGNVTPVAGNGTRAFSGDGGSATSASINGNMFFVIDASGSIYIADSFNNRIRKVSNGIITTVAGNGTAGFSGDGGSATGAQLNAPFAVALDSNGDLYIADTQNNRIRKVSNGIITTVAGNGTAGFSGDGGLAINAQIPVPIGVAVDTAGNLFINDNVSVRKVSNGLVTTVAGNGSLGADGDGGPASAAKLAPVSIALDAAGNLFIANGAVTDESQGFSGARIRKVSGGIITAVGGNGTFGFSGDGGPAINAAFSNLGAIAIDARGAIYAADFNRVRVLSPSGSPCAYAVSPLSSQPAGSGGTFQISIQTGSSCGWAVQDLPQWITYGGNALGSGPATITLTVAPNTGTARSALTSIAGVSVLVSQAQAVPLAISTQSPLLPAATGLGYSQTLAASGGNPPYAWSIASGTLPLGLTLSGAGAITGTPSVASTSTFVIKVTDSSSATATQTYSLTVISAGTAVRFGSLAHIAAGGGWTTVITVVNTSAAPVAVTLNLHADNGTALSLPVTTVQQGVTQTVTAASVNAALNPNTTLLISTGDQIASTVVGWADILSSGTVGGFAIFRSTPQSGSPSEGTVPLQAQTAPAIVLPYDDTAGFVMGVALANLSTSSASITATMWDDGGTLLGSQSITVAGSGHTSFVLPTQFPLTAAKRGIVRFQSGGSGGLTGLGQRFSPFGTFTSVPTMLP